MYKLKQVPEDFVVKEKSSFEINDKGKYLIFKLAKKGITTQQACEIIARKLRKKVQNISYAGNKDKNAVTEQLISIKGPIKDDAKEVNHKLNNRNFQTKFLGKSDVPISLGNLEGNHFELTVRNIHGLPKPQKSFVNYFDEQRFSKNNVNVGLSILKKDFKKACELITDGRVGQFLKTRPNDNIGALKKLPKKELMLYIHSVQSLIFNQAVAEYIRRYPHFEVPYSQGIMVFTACNDNAVAKIPGFGTRFNQSDIDKLMKRSMEMQGLSTRDFIIREIPNLSSEGAERKVFETMHGLEIGKLQKDELNPGMKKVNLRFFLSKGCYATIAVKSLFRLC